MENDQARSLNAAEEISFSTQQQLQNQIGESSNAYTRGSPVDKIGERKPVITSSSAASTGNCKCLVLKCSKNIAHVNVSLLRQK